ncbi:MAG: TAXI family TRAP transporter solute-binding subunit [Alphaproteobacteria bacterium]
MTRRIAAILTALALLFASGAALADKDNPPEKTKYILATATTGGTYYPVGVALGALTKVKLEESRGVSLSAISSAGSGENVKLLREGSAQFAILQGLWGAWAKAGEGKLAPAGPQENLRSVTMLWRNVEHFVIRSEFATTGTIADMENLKGRKFSIGRRNSGTEGSGRHILTALGFDPDADFSLAYQGYGPSADALQNGTIDGMNAPAGPPVSAVTRAFAATGKNLAILGFTHDQLAQVNKKYPLWSAYTIKAGTYPGQRAPVRTIAQPNFLAVRADVPEEHVYLITKAIFENLAFLSNIHAATKEMSLETALTGLPLPLHPGARRYFEEAGVPVPDDLKGE